MSAHTPGPWATSHHPERIDVVAPSGEIVASLRTFGSHILEDERGPNAALIAAAPELAEALCLAESALAVKSSLRDGEQVKCQKALDAARVALRKAGRLS